MNTTDPNPISYFDSHVMYSRQPQDRQALRVFNTTNGKIKLNPNETITSIQKTDDYFIEAGDAASDFTVTASSSGAGITLKSSVIIPVDSTTSQIKGAGYIITTATSKAPQRDYRLSG